MTDYISREAFKAEVCRLSTHYLNEWDTLGVLAAADRIPAADVRPVVLCKDCKHRFMTPNGCHCPYAEWGIEDDDFCSCGEKREES